MLPREYTVTRLTRNAFGAAITILIAIPLLAFLLADPPPAMGRNLMRDVIWFYLAVFPWIAIHEATHFITGLLLGCYKTTNVRFSFNRQSLAPSINIDVPVSVRHYRRILVAPIAISIPLAIMLILLLPSVFSTFFATFIIGSCSTDLLVLHKIRLISQNSLVIDHPVLPGVLLIDNGH